MINKTDKEKKIDEKGIKRIFPKIKQKIEISAKYEKNIEKLLDKMKNYFIEEEGKKAKEILLSFRQKQLFEKTGEIIKETIPMIKKGTGEEIIAEKIREIKLFMEELTGKISNEMILDKIFKDFCIGK